MIYDSLHHPFNGFMTHSALFACASPSDSLTAGIVPEYRAEKPNTTSYLLEASICYILCNCLFSGTTSKLSFWALIWNRKLYTRPCKQLQEMAVRAAVRTISANHHRQLLFPLRTGVNSATVIFLFAQPRGLRSLSSGPIQLIVQSGSCTALPQSSLHPLRSSCKRQITSSVNFQLFFTLCKSSIPIQKAVRRQFRYSGLRRSKSLPPLQTIGEPRRVFVHRILALTPTTPP
jgi:hypothetical protein